MGELKVLSESLQVLDSLFDLSKEAPVEIALRRAVDLARETIPAASHASLTPGAERPNSPISTDSVAKELDEAQFSSGSGPSIDASRSGEVVVVLEMSAESRWPRFAEEARRLGVTASISVPLAPTCGALGALNLYSDLPAGFEAKDQEIGSVIASRVAVGLSNAELLLKATTIAEQMQEALQSRDVIGQAKGILMANEGCTDEEAFRMLVTASQHSNRKLREVAKAIIDEHLRHI